LRGLALLNDKSPPYSSVAATEARYQQHIDGLRAIAILWVVAYHYFPSVFTGGFIGVDVFFVISGYLISVIIWREIDQGKFSFVNFYVRRIRRIFPALLTVLVSSLILGFHLLHDSELMQLAKHTFAASLFLNNWALSIENGYFDMGSEYKPLLHLWSLSIEEQFYLLWPLVLVWGTRLAPGLTQRRIMIGLLLVASLGACLLLTFSRPVGAFYSPHTRIWELIAGAVLHLAPEVIRQVLARASVLAIPALVFGLFGLHAKLPFPGYWALLPVICAMLLLMAPAHGLAQRVLSTKPMVKLGLISYPLYLWHWPLIAFGQMFFGDSLGVAGRLTLIATAVILSVVTKHFIEDPLRHGEHRRLKAWSLLAVMTLLSAFSVWTYQHNGFPERSFNQRNLSFSTGNLPSIKHLINHACPGVLATFNCWYSPNSAPTQAVIGDSKGLHFYIGLMQETQGSKGWFYLGGNANDGAPIPVAPSTNPKHHHKLDQVIVALNEMPQVKRVVLATALRSLYQLKSDDSVLDLQEKTPEQQEQVRAAVFNALQKLADHGREVWVLMDNPTFLHPPRCLPRNTGWAWLDAFKRLPENGCGMALQTHLDRTRIYNQMLHSVQQDLALQNINIKLIDPIPVLCDLTIQRCELAKSGHYLYDFTDHLSAYGARSVARLIEE
jgi:peptidoglycan/LPS O-acetylase OafA/YrhL